MASTGYYVYMRERRDQLRSMYPEMPFYEIIRQLAQEWNNMDREIKQVQFSEQLFLFNSSFIYVIL